MLVLFQETTSWHKESESCNESKQTHKPRSNRLSLFCFKEQPLGIRTLNPAMTLVAWWSLTVCFPIHFGGLLYLFNSGYVIRYLLNGLMFLAWNNFVPGVPAPIWDLGAGHLMWLLMYILPMDLGELPWFLCDVIFSVNCVCYNGHSTCYYLGQWYWKYLFCRKVPRFRMPMRYSPYFWIRFSMRSYDRALFCKSCVLPCGVSSNMLGGNPLRFRGGVVVSGSVENLSVLGGTCMLYLLDIVG